MTQYVQEKVANIERPITAWVLISMIGVLLFSYAYFVNSAIANIVASKDMQTKIAATTASVSSLESEYLAAKDSLNLDYAVARGMNESKSDTIFISKRTLGALTLNK